MSLSTAVLISLPALLALGGVGGRSFVVMVSVLGEASWVRGSCKESLGTPAITLVAAWLSAGGVAGVEGGSLITTAAALGVQG